MHSPIFAWSRFWGVSLQHVLTWKTRLLDLQQQRNFIPRQTQCGRNLLRPLATPEHVRRLDALIQIHAGLGRGRRNKTSGPFIQVLYSLTELLETQLEPVVRFLEENFLLLILHLRSADLAFRSDEQDETQSEVQGDEPIEWQ